MSTVPGRHRWAHLLKQQSLITVYRLHTKENKQPFYVSICSKQTEVGCFRFPFAENKNRSYHFSSVPFSVCGILETWRHGHGDIKQKTEAQAIFLNLCTICSSFKGSLSLVSLLTKKKTEVTHLQTD
jgi:hypothetical protein